MCSDSCIYITRFKNVTKITIVANCWPLGTNNKRTLGKDIMLVAMYLLEKPSFNYCEKYAHFCHIGLFR